MAGIYSRCYSQLVLGNAQQTTLSLVTRYFQQLRLIQSQPTNDLLFAVVGGVTKHFLKSISSSTHSKRGRCSICTLPSPIYNRILPPSLINTSLLSPRRLHLGEKSCTGGNFRFIRSTGLVRSFYYAAHSLILPVPQLARDRLQLSSSSTSSVICDSAELKYIH